MGGEKYMGVFGRAMDRFKNADKKQLLKNNILIFALIVFVVFTAIASPSFVSLGTVFRLITRIGLSLTMALGMAMIMIVGGTDLSAGRASGMVGLICASMLQASGLSNEVFVGLGTVPIMLPILFAMVVGAVISLINAFVIIRFRLHPFIMTLAMGMVLYGVMFWYMSLGTNDNKNLSIGINTLYYKLLHANFSVKQGRGSAQFYYFVIPVFMIALIMWVIFNKTNAGRNMYAVGCNREAAQVSGVSVLKTTLVCFGIAGALFGLSGFINVGYDATASLDTGTGTDLDAIAACIIGGVSFAGGTGKISGVIFGVFLMNLLALSLNLLKVDTHYVSLVSGLIVLIAVAFAMQKSKVSK
ncbi:MAG: beta-methylgalactoside transporter [Firmicutes bacterium]|nr:beta-methylgalactoside transporter [Bacillota bacterium]